MGKEHYVLLVLHFKSCLSFPHMFVNSASSQKPELARRLVGTYVCWVKETPEAARDWCILMAIKF